MILSRRRILKAGLAPALLMSGVGFAGAAELAPVFASEAQLVPYKYRRREVNYQTTEAPGTVVVDTKNRFLYLVLGGGRAIRFGVGVGEEEKSWSGEAVIKRKVEWPVWRPTPEHLAKYPKLARFLPDGMPGGAENPLGARAMYLYQGKVDTLYRIHGTNKPQGIGRKVTSGCVRMLNIDVVYLFDRVPLGTRVVVLPAA